MLNAPAEIVEMDQERDRKTCIALDLKVTGANRELAQWIADRRGKYSADVIAGWLGCGYSRIRSLRAWAEKGFVGPYSSAQMRDGVRNHQRAGDPPLKSYDNPESDDNLESNGGNGSSSIGEGEIAEPEVIEDNLMHAIGGMNENARIFNKLLKASALDREAATRIITAIDRMMGKWRSIQSTLEKKG